MVELKTQPTEQNVSAYLDQIEDEATRADCYQIVEIMRAATGAEPKMWGENIVGFGSYHYHYASGREADWFLTGFAPRKQNLTLYIMAGFDQYADLLGRIGKHKTGKSCLYIKRMADIDLEALKTLIDASVHHMRLTNP